MIRTRFLDKDEIKIDKQEVYRYLGHKGQEIDEECKRIIDECICEIQGSLSCKACYEYFPIKENDGYIDLGFCKTQSRDLSKNLSGCSEIILFAATVGVQTDRIISRYNMTSPVHALVAQAAGAAAVEEWCDILCREFAQTEKKKKRYLRPRFSPGYGDLSLDIQRVVFDVLDCNRKIGATLTESFLMVPTKTVSAIVGITDNSTNNCGEGCGACEKKDCEFRR